MSTVTNYVRAASLEEAYKLNKKKSARIAGGMMWMRLGNKRIATLIDLSGLGLDKIVETEDAFEIGCMTSLRDLETHEGFNAYTHGAAKESLRHIVGVQFRNTATVGGSLYGRFGFSDVLTLFMGLDCEIEMYKQGRVNILEFAGQRVKQTKDGDILVKIIVRKTPVKIAYLSQRNSATDFPVLACTVAVSPEGKAMAVIGARPGRAMEVFDEEGILLKGFGEEEAKAFGEYVADQVSFDSNMRASAEYRKMICQVLVKRAVAKIADMD